MLKDAQALRPLSHATCMALSKALSFAEGLPDNPRNPTQASAFQLFSLILYHTLPFTRLQWSPTALWEDKVDKVKNAMGKQMDAHSLVRSHSREAPLIASPGA